MEKLEKITMKTMEFGGPDINSDKKNKETPLLTDGSNDIDEEAGEEKKKGFDFFSMIKNFFKLKSSSDGYDEESEEDVASSLSTTEDEGISDSRSSRERKMPVSFPWKSLNVKNTLVVMLQRFYDENHEFLF